MYQFHLSIGDWSGDGHGRSEDFTVASNAPVETVREALIRSQKLQRLILKASARNTEKMKLTQKQSKF